MTPRLEVDEEHVDGGAQAAVPVFDEDEAIVRGQVAAKGETAQLAGKAVTPFGAGDENTAVSRQRDLPVCDHGGKYTTMNNEQ